MTYDNPQLPYHLALDSFPKFGPVRLRKLARGFELPELSWKATYQELISAGIEPKIAEEFLAFRPTINPQTLLDRLIAEDIKIVFCFEEDYPSRLKEICNPPFLLYYRGQLQEITHPLAVIGTRKFSRYGHETTSKIVKELAEADIAVISGLALGIDALAHEAALAGNGCTWGVLGSGLDRAHIQPATNRYLAQKIIDRGGCLLSEFRPGTPGLPHHFPLRNRVIVGLSFGVLVVEAALKSGSLITARLANDFGRELFAVPGPITSPVSTGTNLLIKQGAKTITEAKDILDMLDIKGLTSYSNKNRAYIPQSQAEGLLLSFLSFEPLHIDEIVRQSGQNVSSLQSQLLLLEMKGAVKNLGNMEFIKL